MKRLSARPVKDGCLFRAPGKATKAPVVKRKENGTNCLTALGQMIVVARRTRLILYAVKESALDQVIEPRCQCSTRYSQDAVKVFELGHPSQGKPQNEESPAISDNRESSADGCWSSCGVKFRPR